VTRRRALVFVALFATLIISATAVWLALPSVARWAVVWQVEAQTGRRLTMREFDLDLRGGRLRITGLRLDDREPGPPLAQLDRLEVRFRPSTLLRGHVWLEDLALDNPRVRIVRTGRGLNISDLLRPSKPGARTAFTLDRLALTGGAVMFEDQTLTPPRTWRADALTIEAALLSTVNPEPRGQGRLSTSVAGAAGGRGIRGPARPDAGRVRVSLRDLTRPRQPLPAARHRGGAGARPLGRAHRHRGRAGRPPARRPGPARQSGVAPPRRGRPLVTVRR
jgi:hypothetical protein